MYIYLILTTKEWPKGTYLFWRMSKIDSILIEEEKTNVSFINSYFILLDTSWSARILLAPW